MPATTPPEHLRDRVVLFGGSTRIDCRHHEPHTDPGQGAWVGGEPELLEPLRLFAEHAVLHAADHPPHRADANRHDPALGHAKTLSAFEIAPVLGHGDLNSQNLIWLRDCRVVVDRELAEKRGLPVHDPGARGSEVTSCSRSR